MAHQDSTGVNLVLHRLLTALAIAALAFVLIAAWWTGRNITAMAPDTAEAESAFTPTPTASLPATATATAMPQFPTPTSQSYVAATATPPISTPEPTAVPADPTATPTPTPRPPSLIAGADGVNVRRGPGIAHEQIGYLEPGAGAVLIGWNEGWWQILYHGEPAWVSGSYAEADEEADVPTVIPQPRDARLTASEYGVNVRLGPDIIYEKIGYLEPGTVAPVVGHQGDWWQIAYAGSAAWVYDEYVIPENVARVPELTPQATPEPTPTPEPPPIWAVDEMHWIDIDLSEQRLTAYEQTVPVKSYLVSTGLPETPTPVGQYRIWIKLRTDDMEGEDYFIEDVPWVLYFFEGYGLHGVTWHANFGHPMSHGCINQPNDMAEWLFNFADIGTLVNIHE